MIKTALLCVLSSCYLCVFPQIGGISNSKCFAPSSGTVEKGVFEFEPSFSVFRASGFFNSAGNPKSYKKDSISSDLGFRITMGISDNIELGTSFAISMDNVYAGLKYNFLKQEKLAISFLAGASIPGGNSSPDDSQTVDERHNSFTCGGVTSIQLSEGFSTDIYLTYSRWLADIKPNDNLNWGAAAGIMVTEKFQPIIELNGVAFPSAYESDYKFFLVPGLTYTFSPGLLIICGAQIDLLGKNEAKGITYFSCFTMTFR